MKNLKRSAKDTVFRDLFSDKKYLLQLYKALHPEDSTITEDDLDIVTLQSILMNGVYNDLGFLVRDDRLLILVEAQSTWSPNIVIRSLLYLMSTYQEYFNKNKIQLYSSQKVHIPTPELYVIYTGDKANHPDVLSLKNEIFQSTNCCIDAKVKVIYLNDTDNIINQYIGFCRVFNDQVKRYGRTLKAAKEIIKICRNMSLLNNYLAERELEVEGIMLTLFDQEQVWNIEKEHIKQKALSQGITQGITQGIKNIALKMLKNNKSYTEIADLTDLSHEEIENLAASIKKYNGFCK